MAKKKIKDNNTDIPYDQESEVWIYEDLPPIIRRYDPFDKVLEHCETLPRLEDRIAYLITQQTRNRQDKTGRDLPGELTFFEKCQLEIDKLEKLIELNREATPDATEDEYDPTKRGLTRQLAMMLIDELFPNLQNASNTAKAEFLSLLTGWDADGLRNKWSDYRLGNQESIERDLKKVTQWKKKLKISN